MAPPAATAGSSTCSEIDIANGRGVIGLYDVDAGYKRIGEHPSHGVGPHEIILLSDGSTLAIANGGIDTVPEAGRAMLNLDEMQPNLAFADAESGALIARHELSADLNRLSIRHIAADANGAVWFGGQWEGDPEATPELIGRATRDTPIRLIAPATALGGDLKGYIGSVAVACDGGMIKVLLFLLLYSHDYFDCLVFNYSSKTTAHIYRPNFHRTEAR